MDPITLEVLAKRLEKALLGGGPDHAAVPPHGQRLPGMTGFPAMAILGHAPSTANATRSDRRFFPGDLIALRQSGRGRGNCPPKVMATPVTESELYALEIREGDHPTQSRSSFDIALPPPGSSQDARRITWAVLPWPSARSSEIRDAGRFEEVSRIYGQFAGAVSLTLRRDSRERRLTPTWGLTSQLSSSLLYGLSFPLIRAADLLHPFVFSVLLPDEEDWDESQGAGQRPRHAQLHFEFPQAILRRFWAAIGASDWEDDSMWITVVPNAVPIVEVDLRAWLSNETLARFLAKTDKDESVQDVGSAGREFISIAGVGVEKNGRMGLGGSNPEVDLLDLPWVSLHSDGRLAGYSLPARGLDETSNTQLFCWVTTADRMNGSSYSASPLKEKVKPLHVTAACLAGAATILPFVGGMKIGAMFEAGSDLAVGGYPLRPEALLYPAALRSAVRSLLSAWGIREPRVEMPSIAIRNLDGIRQRVSVVRVSSPQADPRLARAASAAETYLQHRAPVGHRVVVECT